MTDKALRNAETHKKQLIDRRLALLEQVTLLDKEIGRIDEFISTWHLFSQPESESFVDNLEQNKNKNPHSDENTKRTTGNSSKEDVAAASREVILERGEPIRRDELYDVLTERGLVIHGKNPQMVLSTMLWRMKGKIVRVEGGGYWPADVRNDKIGYDPETARDFDSLLHSTPEDIPDPESDEGTDASKKAEGSAFD